MTSDLEWIDDAPRCPKCGGKTKLLEALAENGELAFFRFCDEEGCGKRTIRSLREKP